MSARPPSVVAMATQCWLSSVWNGWATGQRSSYVKLIELVVSSVEQLLVECVGPDFTQVL